MEGDYAGQVVYVSVKGGLRCPVCSESLLSFEPIFPPSALPEKARVLLDDVASLLDNMCGQDTSKISKDPRFLYPAVPCPVEVCGLAFNHRPQYRKQVLSVPSLSDKDSTENSVLRKGGNVLT